jgi:hypothetical protein
MKTSVSSMILDASRSFVYRRAWYRRGVLPNLTSFFSVRPFFSGPYYKLAQLARSRAIFLVGASRGKHRHTVPAGRDFALFA